MPGVSQFLRGAVSGAEAPGNNGDLRLAAGYYCRGFARLAARTDVADSRKSSRQVEFERPTDCGCCLLRGVECQNSGLRSTLIDNFRRQGGARQGKQLCWSEPTGFRFTSHPTDP
jgi:hypothetical protein